MKKEDIEYIDELILKAEAEETKAEVPTEGDRWPELPEGFEQRLRQELLNAAQRERLTKRKLWIPAIAASVAAILVVGVTMLNRTEKQSESFTFTDTCLTADEAQAEVEYAMMLVSEHLNGKGTTLVSF